jgi:hypothetical protein
MHYFVRKRSYAYGRKRGFKYVLVELWRPDDGKFEEENEVAEIKDPAVAERLSDFLTQPVDKPIARGDTVVPSEAEQAIKQTTPVEPQKRRSGPQDSPLSGSSGRPENMVRCGVTKYPKHPSTIPPPPPAVRPVVTGTAVKEVERYHLAEKEKVEKSDGNVTDVTETKEPVEENPGDS